MCMHVWVGIRDLCDNIVPHLKLVISSVAMAMQTAASLAHGFVAGRNVGLKPRFIASVLWL